MKLFQPARGVALNATIFLSFLCIPLFAVAAVAWNAAQLEWNSPVKFTDGTLIASPITYNIYAARKGEVKNLVVSGATATSTLRTGLVQSNWCWEVTSVVAGVESDRSNEACKSIAPVALKPEPVTLSVQ